MELVRKEEEFHSSKFVGIQKDGIIYTPLKHFCDTLELDFSGQLKRIKRDEALRIGMDKIYIPTNGEEQEVIVLEINYLPFWSTGIKTNQCKEGYKKFLLDFKLKARDVLT